MGNRVDGLSLALLASACMASGAGLAKAAPPEAIWISTPEAVTADGGRRPIALQFRRVFSVANRPRSLVVDVSADQRFDLYVNGQFVAEGPSRGDLPHWRNERVDLAPFLRSGANAVAAEVWSDGGFAPAAQITSGKTAFRLAAARADQAALVDSGPSWQVRVDHSRSVASGLAQLVKAVGVTFYVAGPPETIDAAQEISDWTSATSNAGDWSLATPALSGPAPWTLMEDALPPMRRDPVPSGVVVRAEGQVRGDLLHGGATIPANAETTLLVDAGRVLAAFPALHVEGGAGAEVKITYTEALYHPRPADAPVSMPAGRMPDRSTVSGGIALGLTDTFRPSGAADGVFRPFWWRTWRFIQFKVKTASQPLTLKGLDTVETGYPFQQKAWFRSDDPQLDAIWKIGWATARLDARETYMDTAYWEQLQYIGDTRLQMLLSYDVSGDQRLAVQALDAFDDSIEIMGHPEAAWPEAGKNFIPTFGLLWAGGLHDAWMYQRDTQVIARSLPGLRAVLDWYAGYIGSSGLIGKTPGWSFIDWQSELDGRQQAADFPNSCAISLLYYGALQEAGDLEAAAGNPARVPLDRARADKLKTAINAGCWDAARGLYADGPSKARFSQHANALAVLYDVAPRAEQQRVMERILGPRGIDPPEGLLGTTYYFSFYLAKALDHAGMADRYLDLLQTWRGMLTQHFTTWPETPDPSRSDSHAWSAHPTAGLLTYVAGIEPASPGFRSVRVAPHLGALKRLDAAMASPDGLIVARYARRYGRLTGTVSLPAGLTGEFLLRGRSVILKPGLNRIDITKYGSLNTEEGSSR